MKKNIFFSSISLSSIQNYLEMSRDNIEILFAQSIGLCEPNLLSSEGLIYRYIIFLLLYKQINIHTIEIHSQPSDIPLALDEKALRLSSAAKGISLGW